MFKAITSHAPVALNKKKVRFSIFCVFFFFVLTESNVLSPLNEKENQKKNNLKIIFRFHFCLALSPSQIVTTFYSGSSHMF